MNAKILSVLVTIYHLNKKLNRNKVLLIKKNKKFKILMVIVKHAKRN